MYTLNVIRFLGTYQISDLKQLVNIDTISLSQVKGRLIAH